MLTVTTAGAEVVEPLTFVTTAVKLLPLSADMSALVV